VSVIRTVLPIVEIEFESPPKALKLQFIDRRAVLARQELGPPCTFAASPAASRAASAGAGIETAFALQAGVAVNATFVGALARTRMELHFPRGCGNASR
jgi:hypothetical protein